MNNPDVTGDEPPLYCTLHIPSSTALLTTAPPAYTCYGSGSNGSVTYSAPPVVYTNTLTEARPIVSTPWSKRQCIVVAQYLFTITLIGACLLFAIRVFKGTS